MDITLLGWNSRLSSEFEKLSPAADVAPARVIESQRELCTVLGAHGELLADVSGRFRREASGRPDYPVVGDWVAVAPRPSDGRATIHAVLSRASAFARREAIGWTSRHPAVREQVVAANIDTAVVVMGLDRDYNLRRLERFLALSWSSGAQPLVVLNKADVCPEAEQRRTETEAIAVGAEVVIVSGETGQGMEELAARLRPRRTAALVGSSGVGKSTLINRLLGDTRLSTGDVRKHDGRGTHTTTWRELIILPSGALIIDNPGMREVGLWGEEGVLDPAFSDLEALARSCRFDDCRHAGEPGCAVHAALEQGTLDRGRYESWLRLQKELAFLARQQDPRVREEHQRLWRARSKLQKSFRKDLR